MGAMKKNRSKSALPRVCVALSILMGVVLFITPALAETLSVSGADHIYTSESTDAAVDILTVTGPQNSTVYITMTKDDEVLASHLGFTLDEYTGDMDDNGDMVGVASMEFNARTFSNDDVYSIEVYADRDQTDLLYAGTISTVFASYGSVEEALAVRTLANGENRPLSIPQTREYNGVTYELVSDELVEHDGHACYEYEPTTRLAASVDAHVAYYDVADPTGDPIKTETITLAQNTSQDVEIESIISEDNGKTLYRTQQIANKVTVSYPGTTEYAIMCRALSDEWNSVGSYYQAYIQYVDADGNSLGFRDSVIVNKNYTYTAPTNIYVKDGSVVKEYQIQNSEDAVLHLAPGDAEGEMTYNIVYEPVADDAERTWTVVLENGSVAPNEADRVLDRITYTGATGTKVTHATKKKITVGDQTYVPVSSAKKKYKHTFSAANMGVEQVIYYVPEGYTASEAYDVTVKYINIATNEEIDTATYTATPSMREDLQIDTPEAFSKGGVEWVRLTGQESAIRHSFYSYAREYAIYYRDVNDNLHKDTVIRTVRVVYKDEEGNTVTRPTTTTNRNTTSSETTATTTANNAPASANEGAPSTNNESSNEDAAAPSNAAAGTVTAAADEPEQTLAEDQPVTDEGVEVVAAPEQTDEVATANTTDAPEVTETGLQTGADILSISGEDGDTLVAQNGTDLGTMRIEDDETPLAGPGAEKTAEKASVNTMAVGVGVAATAAAGAVLFVVYKRRTHDAQNTSNDEPLV